MLGATPDDGAPLLPMVMEMKWETGLFLPPLIPPPEIRPDADTEYVRAAKVVHTFINQHGETVHLLDDNPHNLPVVLLPTEEELHRVRLYGPQGPPAPPALPAVAAEKNEDKKKKRKRE